MLYDKIINGNYSQNRFMQLFHFGCLIHLFNRPVPYTPIVYNGQLKLFHHSRSTGWTPVIIAINASEFF